MVQDREVKWRMRSVDEKELTRWIIYDDENRGRNLTNGRFLDATPSVASPRLAFPAENASDDYSVALRLRVDLRVAVFHRRRRGVLVPRLAGNFEKARPRDAAPFPAPSDNAFLDVRRSFYDGWFTTRRSRETGWESNSEIINRT